MESYGDRVTTKHKHVGSWPSSDPDVARRTAEAERVLRTARRS